MNLSEFALKLLLLFVPGILCSFMVDTFTNHKERTKFEFMVNSFIYGLFAYGLYWAVVKYLGGILGLDSSSLIFLKALQKKNQAVSYREIFYVCNLSILVALAIIFIHTNKLHFKLLHSLKITNKFGEMDVWGFLMNSKDVSWITVRDIENNMMYDGWVRAFSDNSKEAEVLLEDVKVYKNDTGEHLYDVGSQYLSLDRSKIVIEVRNGENENE